MTSSCFFHEFLMSFLGTKEIFGNGLMTLKDEGLMIFGKRLYYSLQVVQWFDKIKVFYDFRNTIWDKHAMENNDSFASH